jgi:hypothetical protein
LFKFLQSLFSQPVEAEDARQSSPKSTDPPQTVTLDNGSSFPLASHITYVNQLPYVDWAPVDSWVAALPSSDLQGQARSLCERAWLLHLRNALGPDYWLTEANDALLLSSLEPNVASATLEFMDLTLRRIVDALDDVAAVPEWRKDILIVVDDQQKYYEYVSYYYEDEGEFATSGGMFIHDGCSHFVTVKSDLSAIEPVIVHEMTHGCVAHLPLPAWLNEGIAVNMERRLMGTRPALYSSSEMREKHLNFWGRSEIQQFWSGQSFHRPDDGNMLSYDLARIMVEQMAKDWDAFREFVLAADRADAGSTAAMEFLEVDLAEFIAAFLEQEPDDNWAPRPDTWDSEPE